MASGPEVAAAVAEAHRHEWAFVLAATVRVATDLDLAEECVQHAYAQALTTWGRTGIPDRPGAWLTTVARRRAIDLHRREAALARVLPRLVERDADTDDGPAAGPAGIADDRLRLIFICCHPALAVEAQVALTLRLVCGLSTVEVARSFLVGEATMAARITRAKKKIAAAHIPFRTPSPADLPDRTAAVLHVVHLVYTTGHTAPVGAGLVRHDLVARATDLARLLRTLLPGDPDVAGLLALIVLTGARAPGRVADDGRLVLLADQDRTHWDREAITEGVALVREALAGRPPSRFALMAAIAAVHAEAPTWDDTDWVEILSLYDLLARIWPSPVVALNRAVALGLADGPAAGLAALDELAGEPQLVGYPYLPAARADFHRRLGDRRSARTAYTEALALTANEVERGFLEVRLRELGG